MDGCGYFAVLEPICTRSHGVLTVNCHVTVRWTTAAVNEAVANFWCQRYNVSPRRTVRGPWYTYTFTNHGDIGRLIGAYQGVHPFNHQRCTQLLKAQRVLKLAQGTPDLVAVQTFYQWCHDNAGPVDRRRYRRILRKIDRWLNPPAKPRKYRNRKPQGRKPQGNAG